jgi:hypothetical protein
VPLAQPAEASVNKGGLVRAEQRLVLGIGRACRVLGRFRFLAVPANLPAGLVAGDAVKPDPQRGRMPKGSHPAEGGQPGLLEDVVKVFVAAKQATDEYAIRAW